MAREEPRHLKNLGRQVVPDPNDLAGWKAADHSLFQRILGLSRASCRRKKGLAAPAMPRAAKESRERADATGEGHRTMVEHGPAAEPGNVT